MYGYSLILLPPLGSFEGSMCIEGSLTSWCCLHWRAAHSPSPVLICGQTVLYGSSHGVVVPLLPEDVPNPWALLIDWPSVIADEHGGDIRASQIAVEPQWR